MSSSTEYGPSRRRAAALPNEQRREAILDAVCETVYERDMELTSRELAGIAGVAEGTLFRVFDSKEELCVAAYMRQLERMARDVSWRERLPRPAEGTDPKEQLTRYITVIADHIAQWPHALGVMRHFLRGAEADKARTLWDGAGPVLGDIQALYAEQIREFSEQCHEMLEPHADHLRVDVDQVVSCALNSAMALGLLNQNGDFGLDAGQVADVILYGVLRRTDGDASPSRP